MAEIMFYGSMKLVRLSRSSTEEGLLSIITLKRVWIRPNFCKLNRAVKICFNNTIHTNCQEKSNENNDSKNCVTDKF